MIQTQEKNDATGAKEFARRFTSILLVLMTGIAGTNYLVNPYGDYPTRLCRPMVQMSRIKKVEILNDLDPDVKGVVLGSSRVMQIQPRDLEEKTGFRFVNLGVNSGSAVDFLAMVHLFKKKTGRMPEYLVVGLDLESFSDNRAVDARLLSQPELMDFVAEHVTWADRIQQFRNLLSANQFLTAMQCLKQNVMNSFPEDKSTILENGTVDYLYHNEMMARDKLDLQSKLEKDRIKHLRRFTDFDRLSKRRLAELRELAETCSRSGSTLQVFLTPYHPELVRQLKTSTAFDLRRQELVNELNRLHSELGLVFLDLTEVESFGGDPENFMDNVHYLAKNSSLILSRIFGGNVQSSSKPK